MRPCPSLKSYGHLMIVIGGGGGGRDIFFSGEATGELLTSYKESLIHTPCTNLN